MATTRKLCRFTHLTPKTRTHLGRVDPYLIPFVSTLNAAKKGDPTEDPNNMQTFPKKLFSLYLLMSVLNWRERKQRHKKPKTND